MGQPESLSEKSKTAHLSPTWTIILSPQSSNSPTVELISEPNPLVPPTEEVRKTFLRQALRLTHFTSFYPFYRPVLPGFSS